MRMRPREAPPVEAIMGMEVYLTASEGIGGRIRATPEDFVVNEVLLDGSVARPDAEAPERIPGRGSFLVCVLVKRNMDTFEAVEKLARTLGIPDGLISFAGLKDARALTAQFVAVRGLRPERLKRLDISGIRLVPVRFSTEPLGPEELAFNRFDIVIRGLELGEDGLVRGLEEFMGQLAELGGIPNFFGHQRFGTARPITHLVGRELVLGNVRRAVELFLSLPGPGESYMAREARAYLSDTWDLRGFLRLAPPGLRYERVIARHLLRRPGDYHGAMRRLPLRLRRLFVHAYQAYLFNRILSRRASEGLPLSEPLPGDWVIMLDHRGLPVWEAVKATSANVGELGELAREGRASIAIPLPGFNQPLSSGEQGRIEEAVLAEEGVEPDCFRVRHMPELSSPGWLRPALVYPHFMDVPELLDDSLSPGSMAVRLRFELPRASYATVLLRELMKPPDPLRAGF